MKSGEKKARTVASSFRASEGSRLLPCGEGEKRGRRKCLLTKWWLPSQPQPCPAPGRSEGAFIIMAAACGHGDVLLGVREAQTDRQTKQRFSEFLRWCVYSSRFSGTLCLCACAWLCVSVSACLHTRPHAQGPGETVVSTSVPQRLTLLFYLT